MREEIIEMGRVAGKAVDSRATVADKAGCLPAEDITLLRESGFLKLMIPEANGGYGASMGEAMRSLVELARGSASTALVAGMQTQIFGHESEVRAWSDEHFAQFCQAVVEEGALFNSIASEPLLGSPSRGGSFMTTAEPHPTKEGWLLNGHKTWSTGGTHLTHMLVRADIDGEPGVVLVKQGSEGVRWEESWQDALSLRASDSHDVIFEDVYVAPDQLVLKNVVRGVGPANVWFPMVVAAVYLGSGLAARDCLIQYCLERVPTSLGKPIATLPKIQRQIGKIDLALQAAESLYFSVADSWEGKGDVASRKAFMPRIAAAKEQVVKTAIKVTDQALSVAGGISITRALPLERYFRDVRAGQMQPPSGDTAYEMIGRAAIARIEVG